MSSIYRHNRECFQNYHKFLYTVINENKYGSPYKAHWLRLYGAIGQKYF